MNKFIMRLILVAIMSLMSSSIVQAEPMKPEHRVKINLTAMRWMFQPPYQLISSSSTVFKILYAAQETLAAELTTQAFPLDKLVMILNTTGFSREQLMEISQINFTPYPTIDVREERGRVNRGLYTVTVDLQEHIVNILPNSFDIPQRLAENIVWSVAFIEYNESKYQTRIKNWLEYYLRKCNKLEQRRYWVVHDFDNDMLTNISTSLRFKNELSDYLSYRQRELGKVLNSMVEWKKNIPSAIVDLKMKETIQRIARLKKIEENYRENFFGWLSIFDRKFLGKDFDVMSYSDVNFYCNALDNMNAFYDAGDYNILYAICMGHYYSFNMMRSGFCVPGYNAFRREWSSSGLSSSESLHKVIASDFELVFTDLPIPVNEAYQCYTITGLN